MGFPMAVYYFTPQGMLEYRTNLEFDHTDYSNVNDVFIRVLVPLQNPPSAGPMPLSADVLGAMVDDKNIRIHEHRIENPEPPSSEYEVKKVTYDLQHVGKHPDMIRPMDVLITVTDLLRFCLDMGHTSATSSLCLRDHAPIERVHLKVG